MGVGIRRWSRPIENSTWLLEHFCDKKFLKWDQAWSNASSVAVPSPTVLFIVLYEVIKTFEALSKDGVQHKLIKSLKRVKSLKKKKMRYQHWKLHRSLCCGSCVSVFPAFSFRLITGALFSISRKSLCCTTAVVSSQSVCALCFVVTIIFFHAFIGVWRKKKVRIFRWVRG